MSKNKLYLNAKLNISKFDDEEVKILSDEVRLDLFEKISNIHNDIGNYSYIKNLSNILMELSTKLNVSVAEIRLYNDNDTVSFTVFDGNKYEYVKFNPRKEKLQKIINNINGNN